ncbi:phage holin family protein [Nibricoccus aquaticus]|uniref:phage holin family protein n=1 Tax=Nibricoccus aquaticus TaxID=2576891 RepID=UPI001FEB80D5|nr:phage holin family protein [Nibricoccus aquaticus]
MQLLVRWCVLAVGVTMATKLVNGIHCDSRETLIVVVLLLSFFNAILKPVLMLFAMPFIVMTLGLGIVVINALLFSLVGNLVNGFYVDGFWSAIGGAIIVSLTNLVANALLGNQGPRGPRPPGGGVGGGMGGRGFGGFGVPPRPQVKQPEKSVPPGKGDVIDI